MPQSGPSTAPSRRVHPNPGIRAYLVGLSGVVLATLVRLPFEGTLEGRAPYALYYLPILYVAWRYGVGPTLATAALSLLMAWFVVIPPHYTFGSLPPGAAASMVLFAIVSFAMTLLSRKAAGLREEALRNEQASREAEQMKEATALQRERLLESERFARSEADRANRLKDEFVATVSHELRTPLNAIVGWVHVMQSGAQDAPTLTRGLDVIERNARVQAQLISDLLDVSSMLSGKFRLDVQTVDLEAVVRAALEAIQPLAEVKKIVLEHRVEALPPVMGDPARLQQVVSNLLSNAVKFTGEGGRVSLTARRVGSEAEIAVVDSGIGIRTEFLNLIFDRFRQSDSSISRRYGGLGLGLSIVKQLVELHGGSVAAESDGADKGSTFRVRLPIGEIRAAGELSHKASDDPCERIAEISKERLKQLRVLVVEDQKDTAELVERLLLECESAVTIAPTGPEALNLLSTRPFDLIISDIGLPGMDGYSFMQEVRGSSDTRVSRIPAIALTAFAQSDDRTRALRAGFQSYLVKPTDPAELIATVASLADLLERPADEKRG